MKKIKQIGILLSLVTMVILGINYTFYEPTEINAFIASKIYKDGVANSAFDDENFYKCVVDAYNKENKSSHPYTYNLSDEELKTITKLDCLNKNISSSSGLEKLISLKYLYIDYNQLTKLNVSENKELTTLYAVNNQLTELNVSGAISLTDIYISKNQLTSLNVENNNNLRNLEIAGNRIDKIDITKNENLKNLSIGGSCKYYLGDSSDCGGNLLTSLDVSKNKELVKLKVRDNLLVTLNANGATSLATLDASNNQLTSFNLSGATSLTTLNVSKNQLTSFNLSGATSLATLDASNNQLTSFNLSGATSLTTLNVSNNQLTSFNLSEATSLTTLNVSNNQLTSFDLSGTTSLTTLNVSNNQLTTLDIRNNPELTSLRIYQNQLTELDVTKNKELANLDISKNKLNKLNVSQNPLLSTLDLDYNQLTTLDIRNNPELTSLRILQNQLTELDVTQNPLLKYLYASKNQLTALNTTNNSELTFLELSENRIKELDITKNEKLLKLTLGGSYSSSLSFGSAGGNFITTLDLSKNEKLIQLAVDYNQLTELDVSQNPALTSLSIDYNQLTELDVSQNPLLTDLFASNNQLTELDVSQNPLLSTLDLDYNQLTTLDIRNNLKLTTAYINRNPYGGTYYVYKGINFELNDDVKIPNQLNWSNPTWSSSDTNIATVDQNRLVSTIKSGNVNIIGKVNYKYTTTNKVNVIEITSDKYQINEEEKYIYVGLDNNEDTIKENINISHEEININVDLDNNKLLIKYNEDILKEFKIIKLNSPEYDLMKEYIYVGTDKLYLDKINVINGTKEVTNHKLQIKHDDIILQVYDIVSISSDSYDLSNEYILSGRNTNLDKINVVNGSAILEDNVIKIKYNKYVLQTFYESDFKDQTFYNCVIDTYNSSNTNKLSYKKHISEEQLQKITKLNCSNYGKNDSEKILSTKGLEKMTNLTFIALTHNLLTEIDLNNNVKLTELYLTGNQLTDLDLSKNIKLVTLYIGGRGYSCPTCVVETSDGNNITKINLENNVLLKNLSISNNPLTDLNLSKNTLLEWVNIKETKVSNLSLNNNINLKSLNISYNDFTDVDISNNILLEQFVAHHNQFKELDLSKNINLKQLWINDNQLTNLDLTKNVKLEWLYGYKNKLTNLDLSNNLKLANLYISENNFNENLFVYKGNNAIVGNNVKIPSQIDWNQPRWVVSKESDIVTVDSNGLVSTLKSGTVDISGTVRDKYSTISTINVVEITSDKYQITEEEDYIYVGSDNDTNTIKENINISHREIDINVDLNSNKLQVKHDEEILKEFKIIKINSQEYNLTQEYIYTGPTSFDITKVNVINGTKAVKDNKLEIKYKDILLQEYKLASFNIDKKIVNNYIYVGNLINQEILPTISTVNCDEEIVSNKLFIKYNNEILDEYNLVKVISNGMPILDNNKIYISNSSEDKIRKSINVINAELYIRNEKIEIIRDDTVMGTFDILSISLGDLKESSNLIVIEDEIEYNDFISNITLTEGLSYKILNNKTEVTNDNVSEGMTLKIYYGDTEVDTFDITEEYIYIDETLDIDEQNGYLSNIVIGSSAQDIIGMIDTSGEITITNNKNEVITGDKLIGTGTKISIKLNTKTIEYLVIINGDIDGDGKLQLGDIMKIANYLYKDRNSLTDVYLLAADYDGNGTYHLQDIMKIANKIYG